MRHLVGPQLITCIRLGVPEAIRNLPAGAPIRDIGGLDAGKTFTRLNSTPNLLFSGRSKNISLNKLLVSHSIPEEAREAM